MSLRMLAAYVAALVLLVVPTAAALPHETMGQHVRAYGSHYLHGKRIGSPDGKIVNCCLYVDERGRKGDCKLVPVEDVVETDEGWRFADGEVIKRGTENVSPDQHFYRCRHEWSGEERPPVAHCLFVPRTWH